MIKLLRELARPLILYGVYPEDIPLLEAACPGEFSYEPRRDTADYIYSRGDLANLAGKKYHGKRNHISRFVKENTNWTYEEISSNTMDECLEMGKRWTSKNNQRDPEGLVQESRALRRNFAHYDDFGLRGGLLRVSGSMVAFTVGEPLNASTFCTHFEKAYASIPGAYQMINRCFAQHTLGEYEYINREEDLGNEGLRRAKLSYYPALLLEKYLAVEKPL
jgi:hypothetical protein